MEPKVFPISGTGINWQLLIQKIIEQGLPSPTSKIDAARFKLSDFPAYLSALDPEQEPYTAIQKAENNLRHLSMGFLVLGDPADLQNLLRCELVGSFYSTTLAIFSGNLLQWRTAIIECSNHSSYGTRLIADFIVIYLESLDLRMIFNKFIKETLPDKTFKLLPP